MLTPTCVDNCAHHSFEGPHAKDEHDDYSVIQVLEGSSDMESNYRELTSRQEEPHERFEHEENFDLQVFVKGGYIEYIGQALVVNNDEEYSTMGDIVEDKSWDQLEDVLIYPRIG